MRKANPLVAPEFRCPKCGGQTATLYETGNAVFLRCYKSHRHREIYMVYK